MNIFSFNRKLRGEEPWTLNKGGGSESVTTQGVPDEFKPYLERGLNIATTQLQNQFNPDGTLIDPSTIVAGLNKQQNLGLAGQQQLALDSYYGTGIYDDRAATQRELVNALGVMQGQGQGALGSARQDRAMQAALADKAYQFQQARQQNAQGGVQAMQDAGAIYQEQAQRELDAPYTALQRYSNIIQGTAPTQSSTKSSGGGK